MLFCLCSVFKAAQKVSYEHGNRLASPIDTAVWWVEHVISTGGYNLGKVNTHDLHWSAYYSIDVIAFLIFVILFIICILKRVVGALFCRTNSSNTTKVKKQ